jgi:RNA polymerase sigma-70 factor (ECF subfamily)
MRAAGVGTMDGSARHDQFVERFVRSQDRIFAYIVTLLPNRADAEEVFQQTSLALWKKWRHYDPDRDFVRWACGMAHYEALTFLRKHAGKGRVALSDDVLEAVARDRLELSDVLEERRQALRRCLDRLRRDSRDLLERCYAGKDTIKQIAADLGRPPNVVYMMLKRLRRTLFDCVSVTLSGQGNS